MKVNLKTTNDENTAETPICHQRGQMTVNGIIGNTRRGIVVDKTLDPDSNNPVANKPVSTALAALAGQLEKGQVVFLDQLPESGEPHKVYVLTATNQRYWWNGSAFVKIVPTAIKDSTTIKHTLADNKISLDLDETIKGKIDAALQKPSGLTKTELVGVGANGQENIEIGDNLTLANGKLSATGGGGGSSDVNFIEANDDLSAFTGDINPDKINVLKFPENSGNAVLSNVGSDIYCSSVQFIQEDQGYTYIVDYIISANSTTKAITMEPQIIWLNTPDTRAELISNALKLANAITFYKHSLTMSSKDSYFVSFSFDCPKDIELTNVSAIAYSSKAEVRLSANGYVYRDNKEFPVVYVVLKTNHSIGINYLSDKNTISEIIITESTVTDFVYNYSTLN